MTENPLVVPALRWPDVSRRTQVLAGTAAALAVFLLGLRWGASHPRPGLQTAVERGYRERVIRWRVGRMGHQADVRVGSRLPLPAWPGTAAGAAPERTLLLFVGDAPG